MDIPDLVASLITEHPDILCEIRKSGGSPLEDDAIHDELSRGQDKGKDGGRKALKWLEQGEATEDDILSWLVKILDKSKKKFWTGYWIGVVDTFNDERNEDLLDLILKAREQTGL